MKFDKEHLAVTLSALAVGVVVGGGAGYAIRPIPEPETVEVEKIVEKTVEREVRSVPRGPRRSRRAPPSPSRTRGRGDAGGRRVRLCGTRGAGPQTA